MRADGGIAAGQDSLGPGTLAGDFDSLPDRETHATPLEVFS